MIRVSKKVKILRTFFLAVILTVSVMGCGGTASEPEKNGDICILFTSDVHCGIDEGFGYAGLMEIRESLEAQGYTTILVDDGDAVQGDAAGTLTKGEAIIELMNTMKYDAAIPGNHEFDYGVEQFMKLAEMADFPYISCNFNKEGELCFAPYIIKEACGMKIAFVGVTTPTTIKSSTPAYFQNEEGDYIYGFLQDETGEAVYTAVQKAVDDARAEGADFVYVLGHVGMNAADSPWTYADIIEHTAGIDVFLDGHSHDTEQVIMKNKDGEEIQRSACGTKFNCIGYSHISAENGIAETGIWSWPNKDGAAGLFDIENEAAEAVRKTAETVNEQLEQTVAYSDVTLTIYDPEVKDESGNPVRMVRRAETNLGDFCADACRLMTGADAALVNGGAIRTDLSAGEITYGDILSVFPFNNEICVIEASGQQILDALEWGAHGLPDQFGGFLQVSGITYEADVSVPDPCVTDENSMLASIEGERRVKNVTIGGEPLDPEKIYTVAGLDYTLLAQGDGHTSFEGCAVVKNKVMLDNQMLIDYIAGMPDGRIGSDYEDPYGDGRITVTDEE